MTPCSINTGMQRRKGASLKKETSIFTLEANSFKLAPTIVIRTGALGFRTGAFYHLDAMHYLGWLQSYRECFVVT